MSSSTAASVSVTTEVDNSNIQVDSSAGKYSLLAIISHIGKNTDHGHYVCHIKKNGIWALFNDEKVAQSKVPPLEHGYMYLYARDD